MAQEEIAVNDLPVNSSPTTSDQMMVIKNADGTLTIVTLATLQALIGGGGGIPAPASPSDGDVLTYDNDTSAWVAEAPALEVFWATYGTTTSAELEAAYQAGKLIACSYNGKVYTMQDRRTSASHFFIAGTYGSTRYALRCSSNTWDALSVNFILKPSSPSNGDVLVYSSGDWVAQAPAAVPTAYTSNPAALGTASPGSSTSWARGDHVHAKPTAADVGAIAAPVSPTSGQYLQWNGSAWVAASLPVYNGGVS